MSHQCNRVVHDSDPGLPQRISGSRASRAPRVCHGVTHESWVDIRDLIDNVPCRASASQLLTSLSVERRGNKHGNSVLFLWRAGVVVVGLSFTVSRFAVTPYIPLILLSSSSSFLRCFFLLFFFFFSCYICFLFFLLLLMFSSFPPVSFWFLLFFIISYERTRLSLFILYLFSDLNI